MFKKLIINRREVYHKTNACIYWIDQYDSFRSFRMKEEEILDLLNRNSIISRDGHFRYTSGKHGSEYFRKDIIYSHTRLTSRLCYEIMRRVSNIYGDGMFVPQAVIGPAIGGVILSQWIAYHFSEFYKLDTPALYADKSDGEFVIKRGYEDIVKDKQVLVVEDVVNTGGSLIKLIEAVSGAGGNVICAGIICNRGNITKEELGIPNLVSLLDFPMHSWTADECPLCSKGIGLNKSLGHGV